jgi:hypothetical protein
MANLTPTQKRNLLAELISLKNSCGYDIASVIGYPLSRYNFEKIKSNIDELIKEWEESNGCEYYPYYLEQN